MNFALAPEPRRDGRPAAGEAGAFQDYLFGLGMRYAISSGALAAEALLTGARLRRARAGAVRAAAARLARQPLPLRGGGRLRPLALRAPRHAGGLPLGPLRVLPARSRPSRPRAARRGALEEPGPLRAPAPAALVPRAGARDPRAGAREDRVTAAPAGPGAPRPLVGPPREPRPHAQGRRELLRRLPLPPEGEASGRLRGLRLVPRRRRRRRRGGPGGRAGAPRRVGEGARRRLRGAARRARPGSRSPRRCRDSRSRRRRSRGSSPAAARTS